MNPEYWRGFHDGQEHERKKAAALLSFYLESLKEVKGVGPKVWERMVEHINKVEVKGNEARFK
ncbi:hypothetical protein ETC03_12320 [Geobacillus sp. MMMUD3]|uniref:hypothetical protein n=1 Tax=Geobacillus kaustophilus TaxID=1462 RepID=UPI0005CCF18B|nr:hypothetical protein [Geobacillus kaustophilus]NNV07165.1 hypothetical protein [Geobacillus sp. MMMUD3]